MVGAGKAEGGMDVGNMLKPALPRGELQLLGATTLDEYRILEKDAALARRFQSVYVKEPNLEDTLSIHRGLKPHYELHHARIRIKDEACLVVALSWVLTLQYHKVSTVLKTILSFATQ
jgi:ATP-dependent Clp protease ATP-binding subunit ClpB